MLWWVHHRSPKIPLGEAASCKCVRSKRSKTFFFSSHRPSSARSQFARNFFFFFFMSPARSLSDVMRPTNHTLRRLCLATAPTPKPKPNPRAATGIFRGSAAVPRRSYAFTSAGAPTFQVFNRRTKWLQKERAASDPEASRQADYLKDEVAMRLCERLLVRSLCVLSPLPLSPPLSLSLPSRTTRSRD